jgi:hypothetical protein
MEFLWIKTIYIIHHCRCLSSIQFTLLYRIVEEYYLAFSAHLAEQGRVFHHLPHCGGAAGGAQGVHLQTLLVCDEPFDDKVGKVTGYAGLRWIFLIESLIFLP